ncbi:MAG: hypothetical protein V2A65_02665 [Candidatus Omnitrophota bacterium]
MRRIDFDNYYRKNLAKFAEIRLRLTSSEKKQRKIGGRPRKRKDQEVLFLMTKVRWERWQREGKIEILGPRQYRLN